MSYTQPAYWQLATIVPALLLAHACNQANKARQHFNNEEL